MRDCYELGYQMNESVPGKAEIHMAVKKDLAALRFGLQTAFVKAENQV